VQIGRDAVSVVQAAPHRRRTISALLARWSAFGREKLERKEEELRAIRGRILTTLAAMVAATTAPGLAQAQPAGELSLTSEAFAEGANIPLQYSAYGDEVTPPLSWSGLPEGTVTLALILDDPDDGATPYVHWVLYNIPPSAGGLPKGLVGEGALTSPESLAGTVQGLNNRRSPTYYGPEPRRGPAHRYRFNLYALSVQPNLAPGLNAAQLREAMEGNILGQTTLTGMFAAPE
jgi:Raf kinase inhibitor-like YbhB/YbcL family protein